MLAFAFAGRHYFDVAVIARTMNLSLSLFSVIHPEALMKRFHMVIPPDCGKMKRYRKAFAQPYGDNVNPCA